MGSSRTVYYLKNRNYKEKRVYGFGVNKKLESVLEEGGQYIDYIRKYKRNRAHFSDIVDRDYMKMYNKLDTRILKRITREGANYNARWRVIKYFTHQAYYHMVSLMSNLLFYEGAEFVLIDRGGKDPITVKCIPHKVFPNEVDIALFGQTPSYRGYKIFSRYPKVINFKSFFSNAKGITHTRYSKLNLKPF